MNQRQVLVLGNLRGTAKAALEVARRDTGFEATQVSRTDEAIAELDRLQWRAVLVDLTTPGASRLCHEARARRALFNVPLIALSPKLTDLAFANAFRWGADDVVLLGATEPLSARLRAIPAEPIPIADASRGEAVIADPDRGRCDVLGRVLANAGYNVKYATDAVSTRFYISKPSVNLFVLNADLDEPVALVQEARAAGSKAQWVLTTKQRNVARLRSGLGDIQDAIVMSSHGPPENVLFAINLLQPNSGNLQRAEVRALHGTVVLFRSVGDDHDEYGFTYSVSATGLYVRSLLPPPAERLWIEIQPPNMPRRVRLVGRVAWLRGFGQAGAETAPPGFGLQIIDGLGKDLDLWLDGFNSLDIKAPEAHEVPELKAGSGSFRIPLPSNPPPKPESGSPVQLSGSMKAVTPANSAAPEVDQPTPSQKAIADALTDTLAAKDVPSSPPLQAERPIGESKAAEDEDEVHVPSNVWKAPSPGDDKLEPFGAAAEHTTRSAAKALGGSGPAHSVPAPDAKPGARPVSFSGLGAPKPEGVRNKSATMLGLGSLSSLGSLPPPNAPAGPELPPPSSDRNQAPAPQATTDQSDDLRSDSPPADTSESDSLQSNFDTGHRLTPPPRRGKGGTLMMGMADRESLPGEEIGDDDLLSVPPTASAAAQEMGFASTVPGKASPVAASPVAASPVAQAPANPPGAAAPQVPMASPNVSPASPAVPVAAAPGQAPPPNAPPVAAARPPMQTTPSWRTSKSKSGVWLGVALALFGLLGTVALVLAFEPNSGAPSAEESTVAGHDTAEPEAAEQTSGEQTQTEPAPDQPKPTTSTTQPVKAAASSGAPPDKPQSSAEPEAAEPEPEPDQAAGAVADQPEPARAAPGEPPSPPTSLAATQAYVFVQSSGDAKVFLHGIESGRTNQWIESKCGTRFVRLGNAPGDWISKGVPHRLSCRQANIIQLDPD